MRHVELVALTPTRVMLILILSTGRVEQRLVELAAEVSDDELADVRARINQAAAGEQIADGAAALAELPEAPPQRPPPPPSVVAVLTEAMSDHRSDERVAVGGAANLARFGDSFDTAVRPLLEALEEHVVLLKLIGEAGGRRRGDRAHRRRGPLHRAGLDQRRGDRLRPGDQDLGDARRGRPTRMDYPGSMAAVRAVARYVSRILDEGQQ